MGWKYTLGSLMYSGTERFPREHGDRVESVTQEMPSLRTLGRSREGAVRGSPEGIPVVKAKEGKNSEGGGFRAPGPGEAKTRTGFINSRCNEDRAGSLCKCGMALLPWSPPRYTSPTRDACPEPDTFPGLSCSFLGSILS